MASFSDLSLVDSGASSNTSGGLFRLSTAPRINAVEQLPSNATVEVRSGISFVAARVGRAASHGEALAEAMKVAQKGLDLLSVKGLADLSTHEVEEWHITWWEEQPGIVLRVTDVSTFGLTMSAELTVLDSQGNVKADPPAPPTNWDESYRYFRLAQVTDDLFDAFRNLYLALESLLHSIEPVRRKPKTGRDESEADWFRRALSMTNVPNLADFAPHGTTNPSHDIFADLYKDMRTALFHAKGNRPHFRPHEADDQGRVEESFSRLSKLYLAIVQAEWGISRRSGGWTEAGFLLLTELLDSGAMIHAAAENVPKAEIPGALLREQYLQLLTRRATELDRPFFKSVLGSVPVASMTALPSVSQIALVTSTGVPVAVTNLDTPITLDHVHRFEAHLPIRMRHPQKPREIYST